MSAVHKLVELQYAPESTFAENSESPTSNTWTVRFPCQSYTLTTTQERIREGGVLPRMNDESISHLGPREAMLEFTTWWPGHLTTAAGALTETWVQDLLSDGLGGGNTAAVGTTVSSATTGASVTFTATTGWAAGGIGRMGVKGDARGDGQAFVVNSVASPVTFLTAVGATPSNGDVIYATQVAYHDESTAYTLATKRFLVGYASSPTTGAQYHLMGGQLAGLRFVLPVGQNALPTVTFTYRFAYWQRFAVTIPSSSLTLKDNFCAPIAGGSLFVQDVGTTTRNVVQASSADLTVDVGLEPIYGPGGAGTYSQIVGWTRTGCKPSLNLTVPYETSWETWFDTANDSFTYKQFLFTGNAINGRSVGFYMPRVMPVGNRPSQVIESNGQCYLPLSLVGRESTVTTTELTRSAVRFFMG